MVGGLVLFTGRRDAGSVTFGTYRNTASAAAANRDSNAVSRSNSFSRSPITSIADFSLSFVIASPSVVARRVSGPVVG